MRNPYLANLNKIEFAVTDACTGRCKHCSQGARSLHGERIDPAVAADAVRRIAAEYEIGTVMTFGGEPMLHPEAVYAIMSEATRLGIPRRQVITNGYFTGQDEAIRRAAEALALCGVNDLLLSVDAFHQETIPADAVMRFAEALLACGVPVRLQPAWLVSRTDDNLYNRTTREVLDAFAGLGIPVGQGNVVFPEGNARRYLGEYFTGSDPENPYEEDPRDVRCLSFSANGDVLSGNVYRRRIEEILKNYRP